jgi:hypothetical protein
MSPAAMLLLQLIFAALMERLEVFVVADWSIDPERRLRRMKKGL